MRYGFIGLGNLGAKLAASLMGAGFDVTLHDLCAEAAAPLIAKGAKWAATPQALARIVDGVFTCLPAPEISERVLTAENGVLAGLEPGSTWIEMSTNDQDTIERLAKVAAAHGVMTLEAPVTGGVHLAGRGEITVIVGGEAEVLATHRQALEAMGREIFHVGPVGSASVIKVITNMLAFVHVVAAGEALMLAKRSGLDLAQAFHVIKASSGNSFVHETESQLILNGSYNINFSFDLACKDLGFAMKLGRDCGVPLDLAALTTQTFIRARETYGGRASST
ncbi:MAG: NAD(P)-dependent oxidoreductase, partial [Hyphomicrobiales bacterium]|nr:NAD(P)-dependent oxidoreductase [Hyphomicrobiales bacterium]